MDVEHPLQVIKSTEVKNILFSNHKDLTAGHFGIETIYNKIMHNYYWLQMYRDIETYIKACDICQWKEKLHKNTTLIPITVNEPLEKVGIDLVDPLPITINGNRYIVVAVDYLTKWAEARAIEDASAQSIIPFLYEDIVMRHGFPRELLSDRDTTFVNEIIKELLEKYQIKHRLSAPYHPQTNGLVERLNRTLCISLSKFVQLYKKDWDHYLPLVLFAYRTMKQDTMKFEPFQLVYGC